MLSPLGCSFGGSYNFLLSMPFPIDMIIGSLLCGCGRRVGVGVGGGGGGLCFAMIFSLLSTSLRFFEGIWFRGMAGRGGHGRGSV